MSGPIAASNCSLCEEQVTPGTELIGAATWYGKCAGIRSDYACQFQDFSVAGRCEGLDCDFSWSDVTERFTVVPNEVGVFDLFVTLTHDHNGTVEEFVFPDIQVALPDRVDSLCSARWGQAGAQVPCAEFTKPEVSSDDDTEVWIDMKAVASKDGQPIAFDAQAEIVGGVHDEDEVLYCQRSTTVGEYSCQLVAQTGSFIIEMQTDTFENVWEFDLR